MYLGLSVAPAASGTEQCVENSTTALLFPRPALFISREKGTCQMSETHGIQRMFETNVWELLSSFKEVGRVFYYSGVG